MTTYLKGVGVCLIFLFATADYAPLIETIMGK